MYKNVQTSYTEITPNWKQPKWKILTNLREQKSNKGMYDVWFHPTVQKQVKPPYGNVSNSADLQEEEGL